MQVDKHIRRLDADLARFEAELKDKVLNVQGSDSEGATKSKLSWLHLFQHGVNHCHILSAALVTSLYTAIYTEIYTAGYWFTASSVLYFHVQPIEGNGQSNASATAVLPFRFVFGMNWNIDNSSTNKNALIKIRCINKNVNTSLLVFGSSLISGKVCLHCPGTRLQKHHIHCAYSLIEALYCLKKTSCIWEKIFKGSLSQCYVFPQ